MTKGYDIDHEVLMDMETRAVHRAAGRLAVKGWRGLAEQIILDQWTDRMRVLPVDAITPTTTSVSTDPDTE